VLVPWRGVYFVELKRPRKGILADHQARYHRDLRLLGQTVLTLWSKTEVDSFVNGLA
jgi:hypothetical protein